MMAMDVKQMASMGQKAMRQSQSIAEKVFWPMKAGRPRLVKPNLLEAVHLGRTAANKVYDAVGEAGLRLEDSACWLVCATDGDISPLGYFTLVNQDSSDLEMAKNILNGHVKPIGIAFFLIDREKDNILTHGRAFQPEHSRLIDAVTDKWERDYQEKKPLRVI
ncbi:MAG: hypothetical protein JWM43_28 [Acidobacteriaceae bacterium]|nr:hypothetical protein [Acidobacteriaceae bacterium]